MAPRLPVVNSSNTGHLDQLQRDKARAKTAARLGSAANDTQGLHTLAGPGPGPAQHVVARPPTTDFGASATHATSQQTQVRPVAADWTGGKGFKAKLQRVASKMGLGK